jgi:hypothetical protein
VIVAIGLSIKTGVSKWRGNRHRRSTEQEAS